MAHEIKVGRCYPTLRICVYECELDRDGNPIKKSGQIAGWYGLFTSDRLKKEIMPKLAEYATQGRHYPFVVGTYQLESKALVSLSNDRPGKKVKATNIRFSRRVRKSGLVFAAIVISTNEYKLLNR